jgi:hypothetical protein
MKIILNSEHYFSSVSSFKYLFSDDSSEYSSDAFLEYSSSDCSFEYSLSNSIFEYSSEDSLDNCICDILFGLSSSIKSSISLQKIRGNSLYLAFNGLQIDLIVSIVLELKCPKIIQKFR